jgi:hypothetical protein
MPEQEMAWRLLDGAGPDSWVPPNVLAEMALGWRLFAREVEMPDDDAARLEAYLAAVDARGEILRASID